MNDDIYNIALKVLDQSPELQLSEAAKQLVAGKMAARFSRLWPAQNIATPAGNNGDCPAEGCPCHDEAPAGATPAPVEQKSLFEFTLPKTAIISLSLPHGDKLWWIDDGEYRNFHLLHLGLVSSADGFLGLQVVVGPLLLIVAFALNGNKVRRWLLSS